MHGNTRLEIGWTVLPALLLAIIAVPTVATIFDLAENPGPQALQVHVVGKQWWWEFKYPDAKVVTANELVIPTGRDVYVKLDACEGSGTTKTCNVIHSFWVPELSGKKDVVPGQTNTLTINADKPGTYLGQCAEYCGLSHANMRFRVIAKTPGRLRAVAQRAAAGPGEPAHESDGDDAGRARPRSCSSINELPVHQLPHLRRLVEGVVRPEPHPPGQPHHLRQRRLPAEPREPDQLGAWTRRP